MDLNDSIALRAHYLAMQMIYQANHRPEKEKGDPKVGGHMSASASALHIMGALHLSVKTGFDFVANKPHASPTDHSYNYLLDLFFQKDGSLFTEEQKNIAMMGLRKFSKNGEPVFQSYHSAYDCDHHHFFPSGSVGIPPVEAGYLALAYRFAKDHGYDVPDAHFWAIAGDSEFREGSMYEAIPDFAERELGNLTWIIDYNRQSLDGHRISNRSIMNGTDADRIERTLLANGWEVFQVRHGLKREALFKKPGGGDFKNFLENELEDFEFQALLLVKDIKALKTGLAKERPKLKKFLEGVNETELYEGLRDLGGHDMELLKTTMLKSKESKRKPTLIVAHTLKGWGLKMAAAPGNHSALSNEDELGQLKKIQKIPENVLFQGFDPKSTEGKFLKTRGDELRKQIQEQKALVARNQKMFADLFAQAGELPASLEINTRMTSYPHTQWMLGQLTAKLTRIANAKTGELKSNEERIWKTPSELLMSMAPDVGTSTNLNPAMDGKIFGATVIEDYEADLGVKDAKTPDLVPGEDVSDRFLRFDISEQNVMSCVGAFGKIRDYLGIPLIPLMTVYDFFIKRALDQYFYNLYWKSAFILVGTPAGVTLSPEGAQHGWKSDIQIPNQIVWEPFFCQELDWIYCESIRRLIHADDAGRSGVLIRCVTRGAEQKDLFKYLKRQSRFKQNQDQLLFPTGYEMQNAVDEASVESVDEASMLQTLRAEVLEGGYRLISYEGYQGYVPGENVVNLLSMGSLTTEAIKASEQLLAQGVYANVFVVTSSDLLCGIHGHENNYEWLKNGLGVSDHLYVNRPIDEKADLVTLSTKRVPIVSVHDGEAGLLDNLGSIVGVKQISLAVRKHSICGTPADVYQYHHIDSASVVAACIDALEVTAEERIVFQSRILG